MVVIDSLKMGFKLKIRRIGLIFLKERELFLSNGCLMIGIVRWGDGSELYTIGGILFFCDNVIVKFKIKDLF